MFSVLLIIALAGLLVAASIRLQRPNVDHRLTMLLLAGYAIRLGVASISRDLNAFTNAATDSHGYESFAGVIAHLWQYTGIHYVGGDEMSELSETSLPPNLFACVVYLNGEPTHFGCVAVVAAIACFVCLNLYLLAIDLGAQPNVALGTTALISLLPSFVFYTSDTFKDGFVALFVLGALGCSVRLARTFSIKQVALALAFLAGLWVTRFYLVFVLPAPLLLGFLGVRARSIFRTVFATLVVAASISAVYAYSAAGETVVAHATRTFQGATSQDSLKANAEGAGSGVTFDEGSPVGSFLPKLAYTLFSPFPWQPGSIGLQIGKIEAMIWYYFLYRAIVAAKLLWRERRSDLLMFMSLVVPMTVAYAFSFSNIGLIARQRMGIVLATMILATLSWGRKEEKLASPQLAPVAPTPPTAARVPRPGIASSARSY